MHTGIMLLAALAPASGLGEGTADGEAKSRYTLLDPTPRAAMREMSTDRPDTTESPYTVDAGHVQVELSFAEYAADRAGGTRNQTLDVLPVNLKLGLLNGVDIQFVLTPYSRVVTRGAGVRTIAGGPGDDTQVRLKVNLWGNDGGTTAFALMPFVRIPGNLGDGDVAGGLILPLAVRLPAGFSLGTMVELDLVRDDARGHGIDVVHSVTVGHPIAGGLAGYLEYVGVAPRSGGGRYRTTASGGVTCRLTGDWVLDAGGRFGLSGDVADVAIFAGTSVRF